MGIFSHIGSLVECKSNNIMKLTLIFLLGIMVGMVQPQPSPLDIGGSYPWEYCSVERCQTCRTAFDSEDILATDCRVQCSQCKLCPRATGSFFGMPPSNRCCEAKMPKILPKW